MSEISTTQTLKPSYFSVFLKIIFGATLICVTIVASLFVASMIGFMSGSDFLASDSHLYVIFICFINSLFVSFVYFSFLKFQRKALITIYVAVAMLFLAFFTFELVNVRRNQALILNAYQQLNHAVEQGNYEYACQLMSPDYRQVSTVDCLASNNDFVSYAQEEVNTIYAVEYNFWNNEAYISVDAMQPPTFWERSQEAIHLDLEFVDGKWLFTGDSRIYIAY